MPFEDLFFVLLKLDVETVYMDVNTGVIGVLWALRYKGRETNSEALQEQYIHFTTEDFIHGLCILEYEKCFVVFCFFYDIILHE